MANDEMNELSNLQEGENDASCNMQDISLLQLEKEWTEATRKFGTDLPYEAVINNFTTVNEDAFRKSHKQQDHTQQEDDQAELAPLRHQLCQTQKFDAKPDGPQLNQALDTLFSFKCFINDSKA